MPDQKPSTAPESASQLRIASAEAAAVIERLAADLALAEEPARFIATLEAEPARD
jgi:hypothetical protein